MNATSKLRAFSLFTASALLAAAAVSCAKKDAAAPGAAPGQAPGAAGQASGAPGAPGQGANGAPGAGGSGRRPQSAPVQTSVASPGVLVADRSTAGVVTPVLQSQVASPSSGIVLKVFRKAGDAVASGDPVVQLDDAQAKLTLANSQTALETAKITLASNQDSVSQSLQKLSFQVDSAQSAYASAKKSYDSQKALYDLGGISASALDNSQSALTTAGANLENAKTALDLGKRGVSTTQSQNLEALKVAITTAENNVKIAELALRNCTIRAPFSGQLSAVAATPGSYLGANTVAFTLVASERQISFNVSPSDAPALPAGTAVRFELAGQQYRLKTNQAPAAPVNGLVPLVAPAPAHFAPAFGSVGTVRYPVSLATGILVPLNSISSLESKTYVFIVLNGKAARRNVAVLAQSDTLAAVSGVEDGDLVIVSPPPGLVEGGGVQPLAGGAGGSGKTGGSAGNAGAGGNGGAAGSGWSGKGKGAPGSAGAEGGATGKAGPAESGNGSAPGNGGGAGSGWNGERKGGGSGAAATGAAGNGAAGRTKPDAAGNGNAGAPGGDAQAWKNKRKSPASADGGAPDTATQGANGTAGK